MSLTLTREQEAKLQRKAERMGKPAEVVLDELLEEQEAQAPTALSLLTLPEEARANQEEYVAPYLTNEGGFWVIAGGGKMSAEDAKRDFVAEMREERIRSFFPEALETDDESSS